MHRSTLWSSQYNQHRSKSNTDIRNRRKIDFCELGIDGRCLRCSYDNHLVKNCKHPPDKFKCESCSKPRHVKKVWVTTLLKEIHKKKSESGVLYLAPNEDDLIYSIYSIRDSSDKIMVPFQIDNVKCSLECDTGCKKTVVSLEFFKKCKIMKELKQDDTVFRDFTQKVFKPLGYCIVCVKYKNR